MNAVCERTTPCDLDKIRGEWIANPFGGGGGQNNRPVDRGRIDMPLPPGPDDDGNSFCFKFPWKRIMEGVAPASTDSPAPDYTKAGDPATVKWEVSTYYRYPYDLGLIDDIITPNGVDGAPTNCVNVTDVVPNVGFAATQNDGGLCHQYQDKFQECMKNRAAGRNTSNQLNMTDSCYFTYPSAGLCATGGCKWDAGKGICTNDICMGDFNCDTKTKAQERTILIMETGLTGCPCFQ
jgi:hypothetical protein